MGFTLVRKQPWLGIGLASPIVHLFAKVNLNDYYGTGIKHFLDLS